MVGESSDRRSWIGAGILFILEASCEKKAIRWWRGKRIFFMYLGSGCSVNVNRCSEWQLRRLSVSRLQTCY